MDATKEIADAVFYAATSMAKMRHELAFVVRGTAAEDAAITDRGLKGW